MKKNKGYTIFENWLIDNRYQLPNGIELNHLLFEKGRTKWRNHPLYNLYLSWFNQSESPFEEGKRILEVFNNKHSKEMLVSFLFDRSESGTFEEWEVEVDKMYHCDFGYIRIL